ncbi:uncharacterized protein DS421_9g267050 [Arachis hypogaea]|nr:uncharacterized protein DS421_9g267050 [Arachis hypogaea]
MNLSISHDSEVEAFAFSFLFLEVFSGLGCHKWLWKNKKQCFYHTKLKMFARPRAKEERREEKKKK